jgi:hypothetical protein
MNLILVGLFAVLVIGVCVELLDRSIRRRQDAIERQARRRVLRDLARHE